jgi:D-lactate dehydrogenase
LEHPHQHTILPNGLPRTCCESDKEENSKPAAVESPRMSLTEAQQDLLRRYRRLVGNEHVLDCTAPENSSTTATAPYLVGARIGGESTDDSSPTLCIVTPTHLHQVADIVEWAVQADCVVLVQGQNTGLTGGSVPHTDSKSSKSRPVVVLSMKQLTGIVPLDHGQRVVCMAGVGLASVRAMRVFVLVCEVVTVQ